MTAAQMRIVIAERCGYKLANWQPHQEPCGKGFKCQNCGEFVLIAREDDLWLVCQGPNVDIPNYPGDLNAMHEAEKVLTHEQNHDYGVELHKFFVNHDRHPCYYAVTATALQRATAFCKTLNLK